MLDLEKYQWYQQNICDKCLNLQRNIIQINYYILDTMPFTFVYRATDLYLCCILAAGERYASCLVYKFEWHGSYIFVSNQFKYFVNCPGGNTVSTIQTKQISFANKIKGVLFMKLPVGSSSSNNAVLKVNRESNIGTCFLSLKIYLRV